MAELLTLNAIRAHGPCESGWRKLLEHLGKTGGDDEPLSMLTVLESNGFTDALWCLRCITGRDCAIRLLACDFAQASAHLNSDQRVQAAIDAARRHVRGDATAAEIAAARNAAQEAAVAHNTARDTKWAASYSAAYAAAYSTAWASESGKAYAAAHYAAYYAEEAAVWAAKTCAAAIEASAARRAILRRWIVEQEAA